MTTDDDQDRELDVEQQIAQEIAAMKKPRKEQRFGTFAPAGFTSIRPTYVNFGVGPPAATFTRTALYVLTLSGP